MTDPLIQRLFELQERGVHILDPRQTYIAEDVELSRVFAGAVLYPGTRLHGPATLIGPGAQVGSEGPATVIDGVLGAQTKIASGYIQSSVLLPGASLGANAHVREGCLLEEQASTAHCVGLKHTILLSFATLGSLINFCDGLVSGGTSRSDHSEIGSGFIHFNFTPWGLSGDKATPSLVGDVPRGVFGRAPRIFLGGASGLVGPRTIDYGSVTAAGQVIRQDVGEGRLVSAPAKAIDRPFSRGALDGVEPRGQYNRRYIGELVALRQFYAHVRIARLPDDSAELSLRLCLEAALVTIDLCIRERISRFNAFLRERQQPSANLPEQWFANLPTCPLPVTPQAPYINHIAWREGLSPSCHDEGVRWLQTIVEQTEMQLQSSPSSAPLTFAKS